LGLIKMQKGAIFHLLIYIGSDKVVREKIDCRRRRRRKVQEEKKWRARGLLSLAGHTGKMGRATRHTPPPLFRRTPSEQIILLCALMVGGWLLSLPRAMVFKTSREGAKYIYYMRATSTLSHKTLRVWHVVYAARLGISAQQEMTQRKKLMPPTARKKETTLFVYSA
jgi:hypothetical protein